MFRGTKTKRVVVSGLAVILVIMTLASMILPAIL